MQGVFTKIVIMSRDSKYGGFVDTAGGCPYNEKTGGSKKGNGYV